MSLAGRMAGKSGLKAWEIAFTGKLLALPDALQKWSATYTRASTKTVVNADGSLTTLSSGQFGTTFDSVTGLWAFESEPAATNLALNSGGAAATWVTSNVVDATTPIAGRTNSIQFGDNSVARNARKHISHTSGTAYTVSVFVQMDDNSAPVLGLTVSTGDFFLISSEGGLCTVNPLVTRLGGSNVYRVSASRTATTTASASCGPVKATTSSAKGFRVIDIQIETGNRATSYIPTAGSTVTRAADVLSVPLANIPGFNAAAYALFADHRCDVVPAGTKYAMVVSDGTTSNRASIVSTAGAAANIVVSGGSLVANQTVTTTSTARTKTASSFALNAFYLASNGSAAAADTSGAMPVSPSTFDIGHTSATAKSQLNGFLYGFALLSVLTQAQTTGITT